MDQKRFTPMTTAGCFAGIMLVLSVMSTYVPFFSLVGYFILPIPMAIIYMRYGLRWTVMMGIVVGLLMGMFIDPLAALMQFVTFGCVGLALGTGFRKNWPPAKMLTGVTAALGLACVVFLGCMYLFMDFNFWQFMTSQFQLMADAMMEGYRSAGTMSAVELAQAQEQVDQMMQMMPSLIPLLFCMALSILSYLNIKIAQVILTRLGYSVRPFLPIRYWEISRSMLYLYVLAVVMKYWGTTRDIYWLNIVGLNLEELSVFFISIQGIAFILYLIHRRMKLRTAVQVLIVMMLLLVPAFQLAVFLAGVIDMLLKYRQKRGTV